MRTNEERIAALHRRAAELERQKARRRRVFAAQAAAAAACLALAVILAVLIRGAAAGEAASGYPLTDMNASLFGSSTVLGTVVIAVLAFLLGASVTVFCFLLKKWSDHRTEEEKEDEEGIG